MVNELKFYSLEEHILADFLKHESLLKRNFLDHTEFMTKNKHYTSLLTRRPQLKQQRTWQKDWDFIFQMYGTSDNSKDKTQSMDTIIGVGMTLVALVSFCFEGLEDKMCFDLTKNIKVIFVYR